MIPSIAPPALVLLLLLNVLAVTFLLASLKKGRLSRIYLAILLLSHLPLYYCAYLLATQFQSPQLQWVLPFQFASFFFFGPAVLLWVLEKTRPSDHWRQSIMKFLPHAIPGLVLMAALFAFDRGNMYESVYFRIASSAHMLVYIGISLGLLWRHSAQLSLNYSDAPIMRILLPLVALVIMLIQALLELAVASFYILPEENIATHLLMMRGGMNFVLVLPLFFSPALELFQGVSRKEESSDKTIEDEDDGKFRLSGDSAAQLMQTLELKMDSEQWFLDADLNLQSLANKLGVGAYELSEAINRMRKHNFYKCVNHFRVRYAKEMIDKSTEKPIMKNVCFSSGFNNRTTFNSAFKEVTGYTPSDYYKRQSFTNMSIKESTK